MHKGPQFPGVTALRVFDFIPNLTLLPTKTNVVTCDDIIENELQHEKPELENNDFLLH